MAREYYFVSDLHFGGDGDLQICDFTDEFIDFLRDLGSKDGDIELIIGGDTFGFWELTTADGLAKFDEIVAHHQPIFDQLKETGTRIKITVMAGNHDYDLACDSGFRDRLKAYNLDLDPAISLQRELLGKTIWIEHGQQADPFNASPDYGNRYALPVGYFITETIVAGASRFSSFGRGNWLKDIRSVATEQIPDWMLSNYFYREMAWAIRFVLTVFLLMLTVTAVAMIAEILRVTGVLSINVVLDNRVIKSLGFIGSIFDAIIFVNMIVLFFMVVVAIPGTFVLYDVIRTLRRFGVSAGGIESVEGLGNAVYTARAREVFAAHPEVAVYLFGHTHDAFLEREGDRIIANMGTWLKILHRVPVRFGYLPAVYYPAFRLNYFRIRAEPSKIVVDYTEVAKTPVRELDLLQRLVTIGRKPAEPRPIPATTVIDVEPPPDT